MENGLKHLKSQRTRFQLFSLETLSQEFIERTPHSYNLAASDGIMFTCFYLTFIQNGRICYILYTICSQMCL
jgi:hypothetical protein